jgi:hypothetical protein
MRKDSLKLEIEEDTSQPFALAELKEVDHEESSAEEN